MGLIIFYSYIFDLRRVELNMVDLNWVKVDRFGVNRG